MIRLECTSSVSSADAQQRRKKMMTGFKRAAPVVTGIIGSALLLVGCSSTNGTYIHEDGGSYLTINGDEVATGEIDCTGESPEQSKGYLVDGGPEIIWTTDHGIYETITMADSGSVVQVGVRSHQYNFYPEGSDLAKKGQEEHTLQCEEYERMEQERDAAAQVAEALSEQCDSYAPLYQKITPGHSYTFGQYVEKATLDELDQLASSAASVSPEFSSFLSTAVETFRGSNPSIADERHAAESLYEAWLLCGYE